MPIGIMMGGILITAIVFIIVYKRQMLIKMFSLNIASMADEFRAQMQNTADDAVRKLDQQMTQLEYMLEETDAKMHLLENLLQQMEDRLASSIPMPESSFSNNDGSQYTQAFEMDDSLSTANIAQPIQKLQENAKDKRYQVVSMHRQGYNVVEIAKAASIGKGEVMLILELNKNA